MPHFEPAPCPKLQGSVASPPAGLRTIAKDRVGRVPPPKILRT